MLSGNLELFSLADVLGFVARSGATGAVNIYREVDGGRILLAEGEVVGASVDAFDATDADGVIEAALRLLDGGAGDFALEIEPVEGPIRQSVDGFLTAVARRRVEWRKIVAAIGSLDDPLLLEPLIPGEASEITLSPLEWHIAVLSDGQRSLRDIALEVGTSDFTVAQALLAMSNAGLLGLPGGDVADLAPDDDEHEPAEPSARADFGAAAPGEGADEDAEPANQDLDPAELLRELGGPANSPSRARRLTAATREEQRLRLRSR